MAEATAAQQEQPEADLPVSAAAAAAAAVAAAAAAAAGQHSSVRHTKLVQCQCTSDMKRQGSNCTLFT